MSQTNHDAAIVRALQGIEKHNKELVRVMEALNNNFVAFGKIVKEAMEPLDESANALDPEELKKIIPDPIPPEAYSIRKDCEKSIGKIGNVEPTAVFPEPGVEFEVQEYNPELMGDKDPFSEPFVYGKYPFAWSNSLKTIGRPLQIYIEGDEKKVLLDLNGTTRWVPIEDLRGANDGT